MPSEASAKNNDNCLLTNFNFVYISHSYVLLQQPVVITSMIYNITWYKFFVVKRTYGK